MNPFLVIFTLLLTVSFLLSEVAYKFRYPRVIGLIFAGIFLGFFSESLFIEGGYFLALESENPIALIIKGVGEIGAIFLLLLVGLELNLEKLKGVSRDVFAIGLLASITPFVLGFVLMKGFFGTTDIVAFIVAACLAISAEGTTSMILLERNALNTKLGEVLLGAGAVDDVLGVILLTGVLVLAQVGDPSHLGALVINNVPALSDLNQDIGGLLHLIILPLEFLLFVFFARLLFNIIPQAVEYTKQEHSDVAEFMTVIIIGMTIAVISEFFGVGTIIGALVAGVIMQIAIRDKEEEARIVNTLKIVSLSIIVPFFFISMGLYFNIASLFNAPALLLAILCVAMFGKLAGSLIAYPLTDLNLRQLYLVGWGMNSRGAVELVIASIALPLLISEMGIGAATDIFSAIVAMAIITTMVFPIFLKREIDKYPEIMG